MISDRLKLSLGWLSPGSISFRPSFLSFLLPSFLPFVLPSFLPSFLPSLTPSFLYTLLPSMAGWLLCWQSQFADPQHRFNTAAGTDVMVVHGCTLSEYLESRGPGLKPRRTQSYTLHAFFCCLVVVRTTEYITCYQCTIVGVTPLTNTAEIHSNYIYI